MANVMSSRMRERVAQLVVLIAVVAVALIGARVPAAGAAALSPLHQLP